MNISSGELKEKIADTLVKKFETSPKQASDKLFYKAAVTVLLDIMRERQCEFRRKAENQKSKTVYYLSMEFLMGRSFKNCLYNLNLEKQMEDSLSQFGVKLSSLYELEADAGLGNGGLGRLAACFLDALSSNAYSAMGYSICYEFGIFRQKIVDGKQTELPDFWLEDNSVWLETRNESAVDVVFDGVVKEKWDGNRHGAEIADGVTVRAVPVDLMVAGSDGKTVNVLRLWKAETYDIDMKAFNEGNYLKSFEKQAMGEVISKVLYPEDNHTEGKSLRLRQQYFLVSASVQDILRRHINNFGTLDNLNEQAAIHINDTHPALVIPELMRYFLDECGYTFEKAAEIVSKTVAYTNHTVMNEALECWQCDLFKKRLPRIFQIVKEIDSRYRKYAFEKTKDADFVERTAIISGKTVKMANLCVIFCHTVNGVSELHSEILKNELFKDYFKLYPDKFTNVTNGIAFRRWLCTANPRLTEYLTEIIGEDFKKDAANLNKLTEYYNDAGVLENLAKIKYENKVDFSNFVSKEYKFGIDPASIFDVQIKRLHEYKRQHLNALNIAAQYLKIKNNPNLEVTPKTYIFGAKAAPGYSLAKRIINLIFALSELINNDPGVRDKIKIVFVENYSVSLAEIIIPAAEISEQISLSGTEASGTGNMKLMMNGAVTLGTKDGANVEILNAVGEDNILIFGMEAERVNALRKSGYIPKDYYNKNNVLKEVIDFLNSGFGGNDFKDITDLLLFKDYYMALADFEDYYNVQNASAAMYNDKEMWQKMSLVNIAKSGVFSADNSVKNYAENIWHIKPVKY